MRFYIVTQCDTSSTTEPTSADLDTIGRGVAERMRLGVRTGEATGPNGIAVKWIAAVGPEGGGPPTIPDP